MILKDIFGKIGRYFRGRLRALAHRSERGIPETCLQFFPVGDGDSCGDRPLAVLYSGDGGWARLTTHLAKCLQQAGIPVAGVDSMHYFWREKEPADAARDLADLMETFPLPDSHRKEKVVLLGYSMGADVLPIIARRLPANLMNRVSRIILMSPSHRAQLKFRFIGWLGFETPNHAGQLLLPEVEALATTVPISLYAGENEHGSLARSMPPGIARVKFLPGGHHYRSDYETLASNIVSEILADASG